MSPSRSTAVFLAAAVAVLGSQPALAQDGCPRAVPHAASTFLARSLGALAACRARIARGTLPAGTDCNAASAGALQQAATTLLGRVAGACTDAAVAALQPGGDCAETRTAATLGACLVGSHGAICAALVGVADATTGAVSTPVRRCQAEASSDVRRFTRARLRVLQRCKRRPPADLTPGEDCSTESHTAARIATLRAAAAGSIAARCRGSALAGAHFGLPCAAPATGDGLAQCLLTAAETAGDEAVAAEFHDAGFCGDAAGAVERRIDALLPQLTLAQKTDLMHGTMESGGVWLTTADAALGIPGLAMVDGARGVSLGTGTATTFPVASARGATWDPTLEERVGEVIGSEARARGASVILAPVVNILRHPRWGRAQETYGEDTVHLGSMGVGFIQGAQTQVIANPKHFALNSIEDTRFNLDVTVDERSLREVYMPHFRRAVEQGHAASVMAAYNLVNGQHCTENVHLLHDILKGDWGFQGFVESDWVLAVRSTAPSANAGLDIEMPYPVYYGPKLASAVTAGQVAEATVDEAVRRILRAQLCFRLDTDPPALDPSKVETPANAAVALEVAQKSIVLLKNAGDTLPLDRTHVGSIAVVGPLAAMANLGDHGSSLAAPSSAVAPLDGIRADAGPVTVAYASTDPLSPADQAAIAAADAAVVVAGLTYADEGEGLVTIGDRVGLALPGDQDALIAAVAALNPRTIVVLEGSGALLMPWLDDVSAVLMAWYPGQSGGTGIAQILFGDVNPSGKLPTTFPQAESDLPPFDNTDLAVTYGYYHGYRWLDRNGVAPLFPFGIGLSYTTYAYTNLTVGPAAVSPWGRVHVTADVTNTGSVAGDEIAQLYVGYEGSRVDRAVNDLKAFARVHLEPGETQTVAFDVRARDLAFWDVTAGAWEVEPITYDVRVGPSSRDLPLTGSFAVTD